LFERFQRLLGAVLLNKPKIALTATMTTMVIASAFSFMA
jgi:hypothetical protein